MGPVRDLTRSRARLRHLMKETLHCAADGHVSLHPTDLAVGPTPAIPVRRLKRIVVCARADIGRQRRRTEMLDARLDEEAVERLLPGQIVVGWCGHVTAVDRKAEHVVAHVV